MDSNTIILDEKCERCGKPLRYNKILNLTLNCECVVKEREIQEAEEQKKREHKKREQLRIVSGMSERNIEQTFDFEPTKYQIKAKKFCTIWSEAFINGTLGKDKNSIVIGGTVGSGKTHLASAILNKIIDNCEIKINRETEILSSSMQSPFIFTTASDMFIELSQIYTKTVDAQKTVDKYKKCRLLIIDDLGSENTTESRREIFQSIIDHRYSNYLPFIITTNLNSDKLKERYDERTLDRLREVCEFIAVTGESNRTKKHPA